MSRLGIITYGHPTLRKVCKKVTLFDDKLKDLIADMVETMRVSDGIGLAAPQVNYSIQLLVVDRHLIDETFDYEAYVNPRIMDNSTELDSMEEGCLSIPGINEEVTRPEKIKVLYQDESGHDREIDAEGMLAVVLQHEIDHLNGIMFVDHLSPLRKKLLGVKLSQIEKMGMV